MKVRTQLALVFFLLAVAPLAGVVLYSYLMSERAFRQAVEEEVGNQVAEIRSSLDAVRDDLEARAQALAELPLGQLLSDSTAASEQAARVYSEVMSRLGDAEDLVDLVELTPATQVAPRGEPDKPEAPILVFPSRTLAAALERLTAHGARLGDVTQNTAAYLGDLVGQAVKRADDLAPAERQALAERGVVTNRLLGSELTARVLAGRHLIASLAVRISPSAVLERVLSRTRRRSGDIPFAVDADGRLFVDDPQDREKLEGVSLPAVASGDLEPVGKAVGDWTVVQARDSRSGLTFGVARPIRESLREIRATAARNFAGGLAMVLAATLGIVILSRRMTRNIEVLTVGADRMASGDLTTRVTVATRNELGRLAESMNRMARELSDKQSQLLLEERRRREQEIERRLLEAENRRKSHELEEARQFQLSLLPKALPTHPRLDLAVFMRTATEVGGDYYDFFPGQDGTLTAAVGDAAGHGARAGTMVTVVKGLFTARAGELELAAMLGEASRAIKAMELRRMNMAVTLLRTDGGRLDLSAAGMPPALICRGNEVEEVALAGPPLGGFTNASYRCWTTELAPGDTVLLMSDGFPELPGEDGTPLGYARVRELFARCAAQTAQQLVADLARAAEEWCGGEPPQDDITFLALRAR